MSWLEEWWRNLGDQVWQEERYPPLTLPAEIPGEPPTERETAWAEQVAEAEERFWLQVGRESALRAVDALEAATREIIVIVGALEGLYFTLISFSRIDTQPFWILPFLVPPILLALSLTFATMVFIPRTYPIDRHDATSIRRAYQRIVAYKQSRLLTAYWLLIAGVFTALIDVVLYFGQIAPLLK